MRNWLYLFLSSLWQYGKKFFVSVMMQKRFRHRSAVVLRAGGGLCKHHKDDSCKCFAVEPDERGDGVGELPPVQLTRSGHDARPRRFWARVTVTTS